MAFDSQDFLVRVARRLIAEFDDASQAGTPGLIGNAREHPARRQLESLLPGVAGVGSGLVIDSFEGVSKQQDVVIYEKGLAPVFSVNNTPEATYYPCEGVIAVGEIKSQLNAATLEDAFKKIASVKRLVRRATPSRSLFGPPTVNFRKYGSPVPMEGSQDEQFNQKQTSDQIFGFIFCGKFGLRPETIFEKAVIQWKSFPREEAPNIMVSLGDGALQPYDRTKRELKAGSIEANSIAFVPSSDGACFGTLLHKLNSVIRHGRTVDAAEFQKYFMRPGATFGVSLIADL